MIAPVEIAGISTTLPKRAVTNFEIEKLVDTTDEWITKRTGISTRRIASKEETALDMAADVAKKALEQSGVKKEDIGLIVSSTICSEYVTPAMASHVQKAFDIDCAAMDISAGCTGFVYALITAASLMDSLSIDAALVVASEKLSDYTDWEDRSTCVLFGDGAGAVVLKRSDTACMSYPVLGGSPDHEDVLICKREKRQTPFSGAVRVKKEYIHMKGREVFTYAVGAFEHTLKKLLKMCGDKPYTKIIPHQANEKIIDYVMRKTDFGKEQFFMNIKEYANTSSATIPIAMYDAYKEGWLKKGDRLALVGFGAGLTCGGVVIDWTL
ncbi:MAG: beta-ketoacyl-ACP synthase 3 [Eubacteriales bacterium]|nr:beta-ketoacyl-ACP synthase 3 [Eubacteriales bacterium]